MHSKIRSIMAGLSPLAACAYDDMGAEDDAIVLAGYDDMGRTRARGGVRNFNQAAARKQALAQYQPDAVGQAVDQLMPFTAGTFTSAVTTLNLTASPQRAFQLRRLVIDQQRTGATATGLVTVTQLLVGADPQFVNAGSIPSTMFSPTAVGISLKPQAARPGITLTLSLAILLTPTAPDTVAMVCAALGPSIG